MTNASPIAVTSHAAAWPWTLGSLLIGLPLLFFMPPLAILVLIVFGFLGLRRGSRRSLAIAVGLLIPTVFYVSSAIFHS